MGAIFSNESVLVFTLINVMLVAGVYVTAMSGQLSLATAAIAGIGAYGSAILTVNFAWPFYPSIFVAGLLGGLTGLIIACLTWKMRDFVLKITTLAFGEVIAVIALNTEYVGGANSFTGIPAYTTLTSCVLLTAIILYVVWRFDGSRLGFAARAVRDDPAAAAASGVSILRLRVVTFVLGAAICGVAGAVQAHYMLIVTPQELGFFVSLNYVIFLIVGGMYSLWGAVLGAVLLTLLPELVRFAQDYRQILFGLIVLLVVIFKPQGLLTRRPTGVRLRDFLFRRRGSDLPTPDVLPEAAHATPNAS